MGRPILLFGNGLGMAHRPEAFGLEGAIRRIWDDPEALDEPQKELILACLPADRDDPDAPPTGEDDLKLLHRVLTACDQLGETTTQGTHWLSDEGRGLPDAFRRFTHRVASEFHGHDPLPDEFLEPLNVYVRAARPHVATLNYDDLLYGNFVDTNICLGLNGALVDGMAETNGFDADLLKPFRDDGYGNYLHLHGSPLFRTDPDGEVRKLQRNDLPKNCGEIPSPHIVLTHVDAKLQVVKSSAPLGAYWARLSGEMTKATTITLFGYSGLDTHVNALVALKAPAGRRIRIVEWSGAGTQDNAPPQDDAAKEAHEQRRRTFWRARLHDRSIDLIQLENILAFTDWAA